MKHLDELSKLYASGGIGRRGFMQGALALGLTTSAAALAAGRAQAGSPQSGGTLRLGIGHGSTTDSLDPGTAENGFSTCVNMTRGSYLTEVMPDGSLVPEAAQSYDTDDGRVWQFKLRRGVEFHDGKSLTPEDVIASINMHRAEDSKSAAKGLLTKVVEIRKDGEDGVVFELEAPNADFPFIVSDYHLMLLASDGEGNVDPQGTNTTGGFRLENFEPGVRAEFTKFENYFKDDRGHFDSFRMTSIVDATARQNALMNGDVDVIDRIDPKTVHLMQRVPIVEILETTGYLHYTFPMRLDTPPFDDYDLRMALKLALKRQEFVEKILLGHGVVGNDHPISPTNRFHASDLEQREFDPERAASHYKKSGHSGKIQLRSSEAAFPGAVDAAQLYAASAKECGIDVEVVREPADGYWSNVWNKKGWSACYWSGRPTEDWMFSSAYVADTEWNDTAWRGTEASKRFNEIVVQARGELDQAKRQELYSEAQRLINDDGGTVTAAFANNIDGANKKVGHEETLAGNWPLDGFRLAERWWFKA